jgi:hypothetical protein
MDNWSREIDAAGYGKSGRMVAGMHINPAVFYPTALIALMVIVYNILSPK